MNWPATRQRDLNLPMYRTPYHDIGFEISFVYERITKEATVRAAARL